MSAIPLDYLVSVTGSVLSAGAGINALPAVMLSADPSLPMGAPVTLTSASAFSTRFGGASSEASLASVFFGGYINSPLKPGKLYVARIASAPAPASLIGASLATNLAAIKALSGGIQMNINGTVVNAAPSFSAATSLSDVASELQTALGSGCTVAYDSGTAGFIVTSTEETDASAIGAAIGDLASPLGLSAAAGAVESPVVVTVDIGAQLDAIRAQCGDMANVFCAFDPQDLALEIAAWTNAQDNQVAAILYDSSVSVNSEGNVVSTNANGTLLSQINAAGYGGVVVTDNNPALCVGLASIGSSVDFSATNGRVTAAFRRFSGVTATVTDQATAKALEDAGYNFYGSFVGYESGTATQISGTYPGSVTGDYAWFDSYLNQIWMRRNIQSSLVSMMFSVGLIPYNPTGTSYIDSAINPKLKAALNFGAIQTDIVLSDEQVAQITSAASAQAAVAVQTYGYYFLADLQSADPTVRAARQTPPLYIWYADGGSVQRLNVNAIEVQ